LLPSWDTNRPFQRSSPSIENSHATAEPDRADTMTSTHKNDLSHLDARIFTIPTSQESRRPERFRSNITIDSETGPGQIFLARVTNRDSKKGNYFQ
jgi:hypothetical protein